LKMSKRESFYLPNRELRVKTGADGSRTVQGLIPYNSPSAGLPFQESIAPGAFNDALEPGASVLLLRDHDPTLLLGNTVAGTLTLKGTRTGLQFTCQLPNTTAASDLAESMTRGDLAGVSFGFSVPTGGDVWADNGAGYLTRTLRAVTLFEISVCSFAAYPTAAAAIRSIPQKFRDLLKRSIDGIDDDDEEEGNEYDCGCDCPECLNDNCVNCSMSDCEDEACAEHGCPNQLGLDDEDDSGEDEEDWALRTLLRIEVALRS
jgi:HK97 family phage prohead protease